jgi:hypothetical protein
MEFLLQSIQYTLKTQINSKEVIWKTVVEIGSQMMSFESGQVLNNKNTQLTIYIC